MLKLYRSMGPMAGGDHTGCGVAGPRSPRYQGTASINPISLFRCPEAGKANSISAMIMSRMLPPWRVTLLAVEFLEDRSSVLIVPDFVYSFDTECIV